MLFRNATLMKKNLLLALTFFYCIPNTSFAQNDATHQTVTLKIDKAAFDEEELLKVLDAKNEIVAFYDRFANKSCSVKGLKIIDKDNKVLFTLVPIINRENFEVHILNDKEQRGRVSLQSRLSGMSVKVDSEVDYFNRPFDFEYENRLGFGSVEIDETVYFRGKEVINFNTKGSVFKRLSVTPYEIDAEFFNTQKMDSICWVFIIELFDELQQEFNRNNRYIRNNN